jgi:hypothetical protein
MAAPEILGKISIANPKSRLVSDRSISTEATPLLAADNAYKYIELQWIMFPCH